MKTEIKKYKNGITLACTNMQGFDSVAFNIYVKTGSLNEEEGNYGISHFIEHMLFKGTKKRSAYEIAKQLDSLGANVNAYTDKEETTYFFTTTNDNIENCVEILSDMFFNSTFDEVEMKREKNVVCEEISMYNDDADAKSELLVNEIFYNGTNYARDVAGSKQSVKNLTKAKIKKYMDKFYTPENTIISFSGNIKMSEAEKLMEKYFLKEYGLTKKDEVEFVEGEIKEKTVKTKIENQTIKKYKDNEQANICISYKAMAKTDSDKETLAILLTAFGRGMSSKLFQRIREKLGLVYSINCGCALNYAGGDTTIHFATTTKNAPLALKAIKQEIQKLIDDGFTESEFLDAKNNYIAAIKLSYESTASMNLKVCKDLQNYGRIVYKTEMLEKTMQVSLEKLNKLFKKIFDTDKFCISYVGQNTRINLLNNYTL